MRPIDQERIPRGIAVIVLSCMCVPTAALAQPLDSRASWEGNIDYFATGAPMAVDGTDSDSTQVDTMSQPASVQVTATDVPTGAVVLAGYLYWAGTIEDQAECTTAPSATDGEVLVTVPGGTPTAVTADVCYCAAGASSYDIQACRADITAMVPAAGPQGTWTADGFAALIRNGATDNASFSVVFVYEEPFTLSPRRIALFDGLEEFYTSSRTLTLSGLDADTPARGDLTWYVLDGDEGGLEPEEVRVSGVPGGASTLLGDMHNPVDNPMNRTINTTVPVQTGVVGVDIDRLDISAGLTAGDTAADMTYTAGGDKYWVVYNIVGIDVYRAIIQPRLSDKEWSLHLDADSDGFPTPGDTIRYTIHLENAGTAPGYVSVTDPIPAQASSWSMVSTAGGTDASVADTLIVNDIFVAAGGTADVVFDLILADGTTDEIMQNVAAFDAGPDGNSGALVASPVYIGMPVVEEEPDEPVDATEPASDAASDPDVLSDVPGDPDLSDATDVASDVQADTVLDVVGPGGGTPSACACELTPSKHAAVPLSVLLLGLLQILLCLCKLAPWGGHPRNMGEGRSNKR